MSYFNLEIRKMLLTASFTITFQWVWKVRKIKWLLNFKREGWYSAKKRKMWTCSWPTVYHKPAMCPGGQEGNGTLVDQWLTNSWPNIDQWLTSGWSWLCSVPWWPRRSMVPRLHYTEHGQQGKEGDSPLCSAWGGHIWSTAPSAGLPSSRWTGNCWREASEGLQRWWGPGASPIGARLIALALCT